MTDTAAVQTWEVDRDLLVIREVGAGGLPLFEIMSATSWADVHIAAAAPAAIDLLRRLVEFAPRIVAFESEARSEANGRPIMESQTQAYNAILDAARPLLAAIDGAPAHAESEA